MAPSRPKTVGGRPDDVPSWKECFARSWHWSRWNLFIVPATPVIGLIVCRVAFVEPKTVEQIQYIDEFQNMAIKGLPIVALVLWLMLFLLSALSERSAPTPKEIEERERRQLRALKRKYDNV